MKKAYIKSFFTNGFVAWFFGVILNIAFYALYNIIAQIIHSDYETSSAVGCLVLLVVFYVVCMSVAFILGRFILKKIDNGLINFVSLLPFKVIEFVIVLIMAYSSHTMRALIDFFWESLMFILRYGFDLALKISDEYYNLCYLTCFIPFIIMFIGMQAKKKK